MRIENLEEFITFARILNVSQAAKRLNLSQSGLSRHLMDMEKELGFKMVCREKELSLTPAGVLFLSTAENIVRQFNATVAECKTLVQAHEDRMVLQEYGGHPDVSAHLFTLAGYYRTHCSNMVLEWRRFEGYDIADSLLHEGFDVAQTVIYKSQIESETERFKALGIEMLPLYDEGIVLWLKKSHPCAKKKNLVLADLKDVSICMTIGKLYNPMKEAIHHLFASQNMTPQFVYSETGSFSDYYLIDAEDSVMILPYIAKNDLTLALRKDMQITTVEDVSSGFTTFVLFKKEEDKPCVRGFKDFLTGYLEQENQEVP